MKISTCGSSPRSGSRNAWTRIKNINGASRLSNIWNFFLRRDSNYFLSGTIVDHGQNLVISLWSGDKVTINGVVAQRITSPQNIPSAKFHWKISRLDFSGSRRHPPHWLSSKGSNYQRGVLLTSAGATEGHFEGKTSRNFTKFFLFLHDNSPAHRSLATKKNLAYLGFQYLDHPPYSPNLAPSDYHLFPGLKNLGGYHFSSDTEVIASAETWLDGKYPPFFFEWLAKVRATV